MTGGGPSLLKLRSIEGRPSISGAVTAAWRMPKGVTRRTTSGGGVGSSGG